MSGLDERQAALARALVAGHPVPPGFDEPAVLAAREALLRKRCGEVARLWPALLHGRTERAAFVAWADGRPKSSSCEDGRAFADHLDALGELPAHARHELAAARAPRSRLRPWARRA